MKTVEVTDQSEIEEFIQFPFNLYDDKNSRWVPPIISDMESTLDPSSHPFYRDPESEAQAFLVKNQGKPRGRIMVIKSGPYLEEHEANPAFFYFFESTHDQQGANALFDVASEWSRDHGLDSLIGPMGMLAGDGHGILIEGFKNRPGMSMPWNPPYYKDLLESAGFEKMADAFSAELLLDFEAHRELIEGLYDSARRVKQRREIEVKSFDSKRALQKKLPSLIPELCEIYNRSFSELPFYRPTDEDKMRRIVEQILAVANRRSVKLTQFAVKDDRLIGFLLAYPNIVSELRKARGKLWPIGWLYLTLGRRFTRWVDVNGIGILPEYQGTGATVILYTNLLRSLERSRFKHLIINQILEDNHKNLREMKIFDVTEEKFNRVHRIYRRTL